MERMPERPRRGASGREPSPTTSRRRQVPSRSTIAAPCTAPLPVAAADGRALLLNAYASADAFPYTPHPEPAPHVGEVIRGNPPGGPITTLARASSRRTGRAATRRSLPPRPGEDDPDAAGQRPPD